MRTELLSVKLPLHEAALVRRGAADIGLTKSAYGANLILRGLDAEATVRGPALISDLHAGLDRLEQTINSLSVLSAVAKPTMANTNNAELRAFMIEVLLLLRYVTRDDLKVKGEIGRKIQKAVGDIRVEGT